MKLTVTFVFLLFMADSVDACQCAGRTTPEEGLRAADAVFEGRVIRRRMILAQEHGVSFPVPEYEFSVSRAWKGVAVPTIRLLGGYSNCAYVFRGNASYLVFAGRHWEAPGRLSSSICDPTRPASEAGPNIAALGTPTAVFGKTNDRGGAGVERLQAYAVAGIAVFRNLLRHTERGSSSYLGLPAVVLGVLALVTLAAAVLSIRKWRRVLGLTIISILLAAASLLAAGQHVYRQSWFSRYLE